MTVHFTKKNLVSMIINKYNTMTRRIILLYDIASRRCALHVVCSVCERVMCM